MDKAHFLLEDSGVLAVQRKPTSFHRGAPSEDVAQLEADKTLELNLSGPPIEVVLTKREREVLDYVLAGNTNKEIAQKLYRTERTVEYHRNRMMRKLGIRTTVELVKRAIAMGIV